MANLEDPSIVFLGLKQGTSSTSKGSRDGAEEKSSIVKNLDSVWPIFKPIVDDHIVGKKDMNPDTTLAEFISTSASFHGVKKQNLRGLEIDLVKVLPYNVMPANAAAWYMAKRKFYAQQPVDKQLLPYLLKKHPTKFRVNRFWQVEFLEQYPKEAARRKLDYLVKFGLFAYFDHKVDEYGVYFFEPSYYEQTEPFHEALRVCLGPNNVRGGIGQTISNYFWRHQDQFVYQRHGKNLVSITTKPGIQVISEETGVVVAPLKDKNGWFDHGYLKFGNGEVAIFCRKSLFLNGNQYLGDIQSLPAVKFDAFQLPGYGTGITAAPRWYASLVWVGRKPMTKNYSTLADLNITMDFKSGYSNQTIPGRKLRQPSSSMMIGQVIEIRKNGAVVSVRDDCADKVFIPGWSMENLHRRQKKLSTPTGECLGMRDLVSYYIDSSRTVQGFTAVGKNVMLLKEAEVEDKAEKREADKKSRRNRRSVSWSEDHADEIFDRATNSDSSESDDTDVTDSELEWLENDLADIIAGCDKEDARIHIFKKIKTSLSSTREQLVSKSKERKRTGRDSGFGSRGPTPDSNNRLKIEKSMWRTQAALASLDEYRSSEDEDYRAGMDVEDLSRPRAMRRKTRENSWSSGGQRRRNRRKASEDEGSSRVSYRQRQMSEMSGMTGSGGSTASGPVSSRAASARRLPYWVKAVTMPEEYDEETGKFIPLDKWYDEERDNDYFVPKSDVDEHSGEDDSESEEEPANNDAEAAAELSQSEENRKPAAPSIPAEELELLQKEAEEPLPEELLRGDHNNLLPPSPVKVTLTPTKDDKPEAVRESEDDIVVIDAQSSESPSKLRSVPVSSIYNWAVNVVNKEGDISSEVDSDEDPEYYPPTVIHDQDIDYGELVSDNEDEAITPDELRDLTATEAAVSAGGLDVPSNYVAIYVPVESVAERKVAAIKAKEVAKQRQAEMMIAQANMGVATTATPMTKLTGIMKGLMISNVDTSQMLTRAKTISPLKVSVNNREDEKKDAASNSNSPTKKDLPKDMPGTGVDQNSNDINDPATLVEL